MGGCISLDIPCDQALNQTCSCLFGDRNYIHMMKANLGALETAMQKLRESRDDLLTRVSIEEDKGLVRLAQVEGWLSRVASIDSQVSDLLKDKPTETKRLCVFRYCSTKCISSCEYGKKVSKKLKEVNELKSEGDFKDVAGKRRAAKVETKRIQTTVGLDSMVEKAWNSIMKPERRTLGIYGMGGVGKTTLLTHINNKLEKEVNGFDVVIWVVVSKDLQYKGIQDQILRRLRADQEWEGEREDGKASSIDDILGRKKFVLLLDDLWSAVDLNKIGVPRPTQENGSKIVFTTRKKEVCRHMRADDKLQIDCLPANEAWELFRSIVGEDTLKLHQDIPALAKQICEKCYGLPLALNVIGKAMSCKKDVHEWRHANKVLKTSSHEFPGMEEKILSVLKFSYDGLKDEKVKSCFLYCSLFPEDYEIKKEELIEYWISEGFIKGERDEDGSNNEGYDIIGSLVRAHLLMECDTKSFFQFGFIPAVKMHDVLREMALWIGKEEEKQCVKSGGKLCRIPEDINWSVLRRISLMSNQIEEISCCPECPNLSTLFLRDNKLEEGIPGKFFQFMPALVVLDLSRNRTLRELPEEICSLISLQYLNLSRTCISSLPVCLKGLRKLISLDLEFSRLKSIDGIGTSLPNLQVLKLYFSSVFIDARSIEVLQLLEHLKILTGNVKDALMLESIQRVERLASCVQCLWISEMSAEVLTLNTVALDGLRKLDIESSKISEIKIDWKSKEKEDLLCNSSPYFKHLSRIAIFGLEGPKELSWLLFAPNLKHLEVSISGSIEELINKEKGMSFRNVHPEMTVPFPKLESLDLSYLPGLKRICSSPPALPHLKNIIVKDCPNLPKAAMKFPRHE
ncbi:probable disease resistance protein At1g15890 [Brassica napus]|uniref:probable disease resistance protein At1g15890 n=1 Tax=Brassica napus TaxID=3708 RepID=UPI002078A660|nr:probable disease resistance protein At1g15890 [Brassica napus]